jgi:hypothetical protein
MTTKALAVLGKTASKERNSEIPCSGPRLEGQQAIIATSTSLLFQIMSHDDDDDDDSILAGFPRKMFPVNGAKSTHWNQYHTCHRWPKQTVTNITTTRGNGTRLLLISQMMTVKASSKAGVKFRCAIDACAPVSQQLFQGY